MNTEKNNKRRRRLPREQKKLFMELKTKVRGIKRGKYYYNHYYFINFLINV